jgi:hypothetical protein
MSHQGILCVTELEGTRLTGPSPFDENEANQIWPVDFAWNQDIEWKVH